MRSHWINIEGEAERIGNFDAETFATLAVIGEDGVRFAALLKPHVDTLRRVRTR